PVAGRTARAPLHIRRRHIVVDHQGHGARPRPRPHTDLDTERPGILAGVHRRQRAGAARDPLGTLPHLLLHLLRGQDTAETADVRPIPCTSRRHRHPLPRGRCAQPVILTPRTSTPARHPVNGELHCSGVPSTSYSSPRTRIRDTDETSVPYG